jgi:hypothetical protein
MSRLRGRATFFGARSRFTNAARTLSDAFADEAHEVRVMYHPLRGYPLELGIDHDEEIADGERGMRVTPAPAAR